MNSPSGRAKRRGSGGKPVRQWPAGVILLLVVLLVYAGLQPWVNRQWGWNWPSLATLLENENERTPTANRDSGDAPRSPDTELDSGKPPRSQPSPTDGLATTGTSSDLLHGILQEIGRDEYRSPAGLRYTRGSEEGHRLKHLARHLQDMPERPGRHGVFDGSMGEVLELLDDGFQRAQSGRAGTRRRTEEGRVVLEVEFSQPIGFVGGREGGRLGRPPTSRLRLVLDQDRVITAFPF